MFAVYRYQKHVWLMLSFFRVSDFFQSTVYVYFLSGYEYEQNLSIFSKTLLKYVYFLNFSCPP